MSRFGHVVGRHRQALIGGNDRTVVQVHAAQIEFRVAHEGVNRGVDIVVAKGAGQTHRGITAVGLGECQTAGGRNHLVAVIGLDGNRIGGDVGIGQRCLRDVVNHYNAGCRRDANTGSGR